MADKDPLKPASDSLASLLSSGNKAAFMAKLREKGLVQDAQPVSVEEHAKEEAQKIHKAIAPKGEQVKILFCPFPTDICRVSPFFPMAKQEMKKREFLEDLVITQNSWGEIKFTGKKLSIYEEDALVALIAYFDNTRVKDAYIYCGHVLPILQIMGYEKPGADEYKRLEEAFKLMTGAVFNLRIKGEVRTSDNIISKFSIDEKTKKWTIAINPYFYEQYLRKSVTLLDVMQRRKLRKQAAKAIYRFMSSQRNTKWQGHFMNVVNSINLNSNLPPKELRRQITRAVDELKSHNFLTQDSKLNGDTLTLIKNTLPQELKDSELQSEAIAAIE